MFDSQARRHPTGDLPEPVLASIGSYYRRVTTDARPMNRLVAAAMVVTIAGVVVELARSDIDAWAGWLSLVLVAIPVGLAGRRTVPRAVRLGSRADTITEQSTAARLILREHVFCFASISALLVVQLVGG